MINNINLNRLNNVNYKLTQNYEMGGLYLTLQIKELQIKYIKTMR